MRLSVAYNGDLELIDRLRDIKSVVNIFGAQSKSVTGGGRSSFTLPDVHQTDIEKAVDKAHSYGIEFNYVMNSSCMGNKEYTSSKYKDIVEHLDWLMEMGVDWITLANPYIIEISKKRHHNLKISLSSFVTVESVQRAKYYDEIGVDEITVRENVNRSFQLLKEMKQSVKCEIQLLANQACLYQCPYQFYHCNFVSHASQRDNPSSEGQLDFSILKCNHLRFTDPAELIKTCWIRPEDLLHYEEIGIDKFKLSDRSSPTSWLAKVAEAYHNRRFEGNLAEILNLCIGMNRRQANSPLQASHPKLTDEYKNMRKLLKAFALLEVNIKNEGLEGFINYFKSKDCKSTSCDKCQYCNKVAERVVSFPYPDGIKRALQDIDDLVEQMVTRGIAE
ncbi:MAG TPA: peptidase U32 family protein [Pseudobacteroides sp.]|uniref:peptidase U32 family protein n=1 Tax=Pseudobacteroides sp. TaxID=1968840 RepID=UPI002F943F34